MSRSPGAVLPTLRRPTVSVVIPTRDRAALLRTALWCLHRQTFEDLEVVVSDDHSTDDTPDAVAELADPRVRRVVPPARMIMADHYDFAVSQARGELVTVLPDRGLLRRDALSRVVDAFSPGIAAVGWNHDRFADADPGRETLHLHHRAGGAHDLPVDALLAAHHEFRTNELGFPVCSPASSAVRREVLDGIATATGGRRVPRFIPDVTWSVGALAVGRSFRYLDHSLGLGAGEWASVGATLGARIDRARDALVGGEAWGAHVPLGPAFTNGNLLADDLGRLREAFPDALAGHHLDLRRYAWRLGADLRRIQADGADVDALATGVARTLRELVASDALRGRGDPSERAPRPCWHPPTPETVAHMLPGHSARDALLIAEQPEARHRCATLLESKHRDVDPTGDSPRRGHPSCARRDVTVRSSPSGSSSPEGSSDRPKGLA